MIIFNNLTAVFIGDQLLNSVSDVSIDWVDVRSATLYMKAGLPEGKREFDLIRNDIDIDIVVFDCDGVRKTRENGELLFSVMGAYDIDKSIDSIIAASSNDVDRLGIGISLKGSLKFGGSL